jgi:signal transduction histidine kinase
MTQLPTIDAPPSLSTARTRAHALYPLVRWTAQTALSVAFVIAVYEALVAGEIRIWPNAPDSAILPVWVLAATLCGLGLNRVRRLAVSLLRRLWPSAAEDPYAALAAGVAGLRVTAPAEDALVRLAELAVAVTGARSAAVEPGAVAAGAGAGGSTVAERFEARADGRVLGELLVTPQPGRALTKRDRRLAESVADAAGSVLRGRELTARLAEELRLQETLAGELDRSRRRVVAARDDARELLGREIQASVGETLTWCAGEAAELAAEPAATSADGDGADGPDVAEWGPQLTELTERVDQAIKDFRRIVHGVYPAALTDHGLTAALGNLVAEQPGHPAFSAPELPRYEPRFEAGVYFCMATLLAPFGADPQRAERVEVERSEGSIVMRIVEAAAAAEVPEPEPAPVPEPEPEPEPARAPAAAPPPGPGRRDPGALEAIRDRVAALDGELRFGESEDGTTIEMAIPEGAVA